MFGNSEARRQAADAAFEVKSAAAQAFISMDTTQDHVEAQVQSFAQLDAGPAGDRMRLELRPLLAAAEQASTAYLTAVEQHPIEEDTRVPALRQAVQVFGQVRDQLAAADGSLQAFADRIAPEMSRLDAALQELAGTRSRARAGLEKARMAVTGLTAAGYASAAVAAKLDQAEQRWRAVSAGPAPGRDGLAAAVRAAKDAESAAAAVQSAAAAYFAMVDDTRKRLSSTATRLDAIRQRIPAAVDRLSDLRRRYARGCSADLEYVPDDVREAVDVAKSALVTAERTAKRGNWEDAATALANARRKLDSAESGLRAVDSRVREIADVAANPKQGADQAWFEVRDAQKFVLAAPGGALPVEVRELDALVARLEAAPTMLSGVHPDYWAYLQEMRTISVAANGVVERARQRLAKTP
ncbi:hypothetical protein [Fodinicola acaciae]|uniref:hypothetical protein n=1 Tax=Fodinicola acaciae TaxID=2681555 RepID=UPI0013D2A068|nr:hypothetical protein [Fodinicola acaciae]